MFIAGSYKDFLKVARDMPKQCEHAEIIMR